MTVEPTRRHVLCGLAVALLAPGAVVAACSSDTGTGTGTTTIPTTTSSEPGRPDGAIVAVDEVPVGDGVIALAGGRPVLVVQVKAGTISAFDPICPHQGFTVDAPRRGVIVCPGHGSRFDATTGALKGGPATRGLTKFPVKVVDGYVVAA